MNRREFGYLSGGSLLSVAARSARSTAAEPAVRPGRGATSKPNVLLLMADQLRGDCLGVDGNRAAHTPNLDRLAREGIRFRRAYSSTPSCTPARAALLTGLSPWRHGMLGYGRIGMRYPVEMPRLMKDAGYSTAVVGKCHYFPQRNLHGFEQSLLDESGRVETPDFRDDYRSWFWSLAMNLDPDKTGLNWNDYRGAPYVLPEGMHPTHWTGESAISFIRTYDKQQPFFLKVSFERPHSPYDPPQRLWDRYGDVPLPQARVANWAEKYAPRSDRSNSIWHGDMGTEQVRASRRGYYGNVTFVDEQIGRILGALKARGLLEQTVILFISDHGDMVGDHNLWRKAYAYEPSARIPMLMRWPKGLVTAQRGQVSDHPVEIRDVLPTLLDAAGAPQPETKLDGQSLLDIVRGDKAWREYIDLEHDVCYSLENHWNGLTDGKVKYIFHAQHGDEQLFDLAADPSEMNDLASDPATQEQLKFWRGRLVAHLSERGDAFVKDGALVARPRSMLYSPNYPGAAKEVGEEN